MRCKFLALVFFVIIAFFIRSSYDNIEAASETTNATFSIGNVAPVIVSFQTTTNATRLTANNNNPANVSQFVNWTVKWTDVNGDSVSILVCSTNSANVNGCAARSFYNETTAASTNRSVLNKTTINLAIYRAHGGATNSTQAYLFVTDRKTSGISSSKNVSFAVNHAPTMTNPSIMSANMANNLTNETYTAGARNLFDVDDANNTNLASYRLTYKWFRFTSGDTKWTDASVSTQTFNCATSTCNENDKLRVQLLSKDAHGYSNSSSGPYNSSNLTIGNSPPLLPSNFQVKDGSGNWDSTSIYDTHAKNGTGTEIRFVNGSDPDGDVTYTYVCARNNPPENLTSIGACKYNIFNTSRIAASTGGAAFEKAFINRMTYNPSAIGNTTYIVLISTDGSVNSSLLNITLYLNNSKPTITSASLNVTSTHDQSPSLRWTVRDFDNGSVNGWPTDSLQNSIRVHSSDNATSYYSANNADNDSTTVTPNIPWGTISGYWSNRSVYVSLWGYDGNGAYGNSSRESDSFVLYDYLPDVKFINMSNSGAASPYLSCATSGSCQLTPVEHSNTTVAVKVTAHDRDADCTSTKHKAGITLCLNQTSGASCSESTGNYKYLLDSVTTDAGNSSKCYFQFLTNKSGTVTPEFFRNNTHSKLHVNVTNNASQERTNDNDINGTWLYNGLNAVNYSTSVVLGNGSIKLGGWSFGKNKYTIKNWGNLNVTLQWNMSNPSLSGGGDTWTLTGTDAEIDDDNNVSLESGGGIPPSYLYQNSPGQYFDPPRWGLVKCMEYQCSTNSWNETMDTYFHINPPAGLLAGTYISTVWITSSH